MPPKKEPKKEAAKKDKKEEPTEEASDSRVVGPGELDDAGLPRPQDVLELVSARMKLEKSMQNREKLEESNRNLREELERQSGEQTEIFAYLNKELSTKGSVIASLEHKVSELEHIVKLGRREFDHLLMNEKREAREHTTRLAREVGRYEQELGDLNIFIARKTELQGELEDTKQELLKERKTHEQIITELERKTLQEKERLRKEMEARIREAKETFMQMTDGLLGAATQETMRINDQMASELGFQHRETERLVHKNRKLSEENVATHRELMLYKHAEAELSKRNHAYLTTITSLISKLKTLEGATSELQKARSKTDGIVTSNYQSKVNALQDSVEDALGVLEKMGKQLNEKTEEVERIRSDRDELGVLVLQAAQEAKGHLTDNLYGQAIKEEEDSQARDENLAGVRTGAHSFTKHIRLTDLKGVQRHQILRYVLERVSDLHKEARKNIIPDDKVDTHNVLFPRITPRKPTGARSLVGRGSIDTDVRRIKGGGDHRSDGGRS